MAEETVEGVALLAAGRGLARAAERPAAWFRLGLDADLAERVLHPVVENACRYGASWARVRIVRSGARISYVVEDDGPGVREDEREWIFEPGRRGDRSNGAGAGLGLALARRLARSAAGDVVAEAGRCPGAASS